PGNHDLHPDTNRRAPRVLKHVEGDFSVKVQVLPLPRPALKDGQSCGAGLLVWQDDGHFVCLLRGASGKDGGKPYHHFGMQWQGKKAYGGLQSVQDDEPFHFHLERIGKQMRLRTSYDGKEWTPFTNLPERNWAADLQVGIVAVNVSDRSFAPQFAG